MDVQEVRKFLADRVLWLGQSGVLITTAGGKTIYIDPRFLSADPLPADYVFLTHSRVLLSAMSRYPREQV
jgi:L-ascorbate metabolism protein UlaG (beta-lactamase superfamily)